MSDTMNRLLEVCAVIGVGAFVSMFVVIVGVTVTGRGMDR